MIYCSVWDGRALQLHPSHLVDPSEGSLVAMLMFSVGKQITAWLLPITYQQIPGVHQRFQLIRDIIVGMLLLAVNSIKFLDQVQ